MTYLSNQVTAELRQAQAPTYPVRWQFIAGLVVALLAWGVW